MDCNNYDMPGTGKVKVTLKPKNPKTHRLMLKAAHFVFMTRGESRSSVGLVLICRTFVCKNFV